MDPKSEIMSRVGPQFFDLVGLVITGLVAWISLSVKKLIDSKIRNESAKGILGKLNDVVFAVVAETAQTAVGSMRDNNGRLTPDQSKALKEHAILKVKMILGDAALKAIEKSFGSADALIEAKIESTVMGLKESNPK